MSQEGFDTTDDETQEIYTTPPSDQRMIETKQAPTPHDEVYEHIRCKGGKIIGVRLTAEGRGETGPETIGLGVPVSIPGFRKDNILRRFFLQEKPNGVVAAIAIPGEGEDPEACIFVNLEIPRIGNVHVWMRPEDLDFGLEKE